MRRMLTAKLQNRSGVLNRFTGVLSRRQVNIESISVGATENPDVSRITIIIDVNSHNEVEQIIKQRMPSAKEHALEHILFVKTHCHPGMTDLEIEQVESLTMKRIHKRLDTTVFSVWKNPYKSSNSAPVSSSVHA